MWARITVANGVAFVGVDTTLRAFDTATGAELFAFPTKGTIASAPVVAEGRVHFGAGLSYFVGTAGRVFHVLSLEGGGGGGGGGGATGAPTFTAIWDEVFVPTGCNSGSCHGGGAGGLSMASKDEAWRDLVNVVSDGPACASTGLVRVVPGDPETSLLVDKIANRPPVCGSAMPFAGPLDAKQVEQVGVRGAGGGKGVSRSLSPRKPPPQPATYHRQHGIRNMVFVRVGQWHPFF